jgi:hypothetical protein
MCLRAEQGDGLEPVPVSYLRVYAEMLIAAAPLPRRTKSGTGRGTGRDQSISRAFREGAASSMNARRGSPRLLGKTLETRSNVTCRRSAVPSGNDP